MHTWDLENEHFWMSIHYCVIFDGYFVLNDEKEAKKISSTKKEQPHPLGIEGS